MECSLLHGEHWYQPPNNAINLKDMPLFEKKSIQKLEHLNIKIMRNWAAVNGKAEYGSG